MATKESSFKPRKSTQFLEVPKLRHRRRSKPSTKELVDLETRAAAPPSSVVEQSVPSTRPLPIHQRPRHAAPSWPPSKSVMNSFQTAPDSPPPESKLNFPAGDNCDSRARQGISAGLMHPSEMFEGSEDRAAMHGRPESRPFTPPQTPPKENFMPLRQRLIGAWRLESYVAYPSETSRIQRPVTPMSKHVTGLIMYTPDGYMSAHMLMPGQARIETAAGKGDDTPQWAEASKRCFAYAGPYFISMDAGGKEELRHTFQVCSLPGWIGDVQVRTWAFEDEGDVLVLGSDEPVDIKGDLRYPVLKWRRCLDNSKGTPPAPVPQIKVSGPGEW